MNRDACMLKLCMHAHHQRHGRLVVPQSMPTWAGGEVGTAAVAARAAAVAGAGATWAGASSAAVAGQVATVAAEGWACIDGGARIASACACCSSQPALFRQHDPSDGWPFSEATRVTL